MQAPFRLALEKVAFHPAGRVTDDSSVATLKGLVFEPLCAWRAGAPPGPALFGSWSRDAFARSWRFRLRDGALWHDGRPCRAEDVVAFVEGILGSLDMFGMKWSYSRYLAGAWIRAAAADTVAVDLPRPFPDLPEVLCEFHPCRDAPDGSPVLGTGPYRVAGWSPGGSALLERVAHGGGPLPGSAPAVDAAGRPLRILVSACADADERRGLLGDGMVDAAAQLGRTARRPDFAAPLEWQSAGNTLSVMCYLACDRGLFASPAARLAANLAVDRRAILDELFHGLGLPAATAVSPFHFGAREAGVAPPRPDPERAKRLFGEAGGAGEIVVRTPLHMPERANEICAMVAGMLGRAGIAARLEVQADRPEYAREVGRKKIGDMAIFDSSPAITFRALDDKVSSASRGPWWQGYDDPEAERLFHAARGEPDDGLRARAYGRCLARLAENPPWLYLFHPIELVATRPGTGVRLALDNRGVVGVGA